METSIRGNSRSRFDSCHPSCVSALQGNALEESTPEGGWSIIDHAHTHPPRPVYSTHAGVGALP